MKTWKVRVHFSMPSEWFVQNGTLSVEAATLHSFFPTLTVYPTVEAETSHEAICAAVNLVRLDFVGSRSFYMAEASRGPFSQTYRLTYKGEPLS